MKEINHLSLLQWLRTAIPDSQQPTSPIGFLFLKLPPPPCAVLLVYIYTHIICIYIYTHIIITYIYTHQSYNISYIIYHIYIYTYTYHIYIYIFSQYLGLVNISTSPLQAARERHTASTACNDRSSRSHALFQHLR